MKENKQPKIDKIVKEDKNPSEIDCPKEHSLSFRMWHSEYLKNHMELVQGLKTKNRADFCFAEDIKKAVKELKEEMDLCPVCKGGHGKWIGKDEMIELINEKFGEKLI